MNELKKNKLPQKAWYIFEGYTHPDIYIETEDSIYVGEAKRTEDKLTDETKWLACRDQLIRHIDAVIDETKKVYSFLIIDDEKVKYYHLSQYDDERFYAENLPHRSQDIIKKAKESYLGYTTWSKINELFDNEIKYPETTD